AIRAAGATGFLFRDLQTILDVHRSTVPLGIKYNDRRKLHFYENGRVKATGRRVQVRSWINGRPHKTLYVSYWECYDTPFPRVNFDHTFGTLDWIGKTIP